MRLLAFACAVVIIGVAPVSGQESAQQFFEAGQYDQALAVIDAQRGGGGAGPDEAFLAGQILVKAERTDQARGEFASLAEASPVWASVGESSLALLDNDNQRALTAAMAAVAAGPDEFQAQYQLGLAKARLVDWAGSAEAFGRAAELNPMFAYAHYYAALSYSRVRRTDRTAEYMERFLRLAPRAPERPGVESLMRTLRGR